MQRRPTGRGVAAVLLATVLAAVAAPVAGAGAVPPSTPAHTATKGLDPAAFADPPDNSRPTVLWFWNGTVTDDLIDRQLADLRARGVHNAIIFPFQTDALKPAFFSDGWFDVVGHALAEAKHHGMHVWLFNDDYFPSGRADNLVVDGGTVAGRTYTPHPELAAKSLTRQQRTVTGPADVPLTASALRVEDGRLVVDAKDVNGVRILDRGADWTDYTVTAHRRSTSGAAGLVVRAQDERNGYLVDTDPDGAVTIYRQVDGSYTSLSRSDSIAGFDPSAEHAITVQTAGDTITASIDGTQRVQVRDTTYARGTVGVRAVATQVSSYDDLHVTAADGHALYDEDFTDPSALDDFRTSADTPNTVVAASARPAGATDAHRLRDLTALATAGSTWRVPKGTWTLDTFTATPSNGSYLDLMSDAAVSRFMDVVPGEYYRRFGADFGATIRGFWDDEPVLAANPWSPSLPAALQALGSTPGDALTGVFDDLGRDSRTLRAKYWHAVSDRFANAYMRGQAKWMDAHHVDYISNPLHDEFGPAGQVDTSGDMLKDNQWAQVPGTDVVFDQYAQGGRTLLPRWPASAAHQNGQSRVLLENFGAMGWQITPDFMRSLIGAFAVRGINLDTYHAMWTDPDNVVYPPPFQQDNPWWHDAKPLTTWTGRVMQLTRAAARARTAVVVPTSAAQAWQHTDASGAIDDDFTAANDALEDAQVDYDLLDEGALTADPAIRAPARVRGDELRVGKQDYRAVVLPRTPTIALAAVRTLTDFARSGGTVVAVGDLPREEVDGHDGALSAAIHQLTHARGFVAAATPDALGPAADHAGVAAAVLSPAAPDVRVLRLRTGPDTAFLLNDESGRSVRTTASFPVGGTPEVWDPRTGRTAVAPQYTTGRTGTDVAVHLDPYETLAVVFRRSTPAAAHLVDGTTDALTPGVPHETAGGLAVPVTATRPGAYRLVAASGSRYYAGTAHVTDPLSAIPLEGDWTRRLGDTTTTGPLGSWTDTDPHYSGAATYTRDVDVPAAALPGHRWTLDLGDVRDVADVTVNGHDYDPVLWAPYTLDVTKELHAGTNTVNVVVTNTLANAHGDARTSGLLGPVALRPSVRQTVDLAPVGAAGALAVHPPADVGVAPGQSVPTTATVHRYGGTGTRTVPVRASVDHGLQVAPATSTVRLAPDATVTVPLTVSATDTAALGTQATLTVQADTSDATAPVQIDAASRFGVASASSTTPGYPVATVNDGITSSERWGQGQGWNDGTINAFPDTVQVAFAAPAPIGRVTVDTLDSATYPAAQYGIRDADVQVRVGGAWQTVGSIHDNTAGHVSVAFTPRAADGVRLVVGASNSGDYSRVVELTALPS